MGQVKISPRGEQFENSKLSNEWIKVGVESVDPFIQTVLPDSMSLLLPSINSHAT